MLVLGALVLAALPIVAPGERWGQLGSVPRVVVLAAFSWTLSGVLVAAGAAVVARLASESIRKLAEEATFSPSP